jgi:hypothetical protein
MLQTRWMTVFLAGWCRANLRPFAALKRFFQHPEQTGSIIVELPEGRAEIPPFFKAALMSTAGEVQKLQHLVLRAVGASNR